MGDNTEIICDSNINNHGHRKQNPIQSNEIDFSSNMLLDCRKDLFLSDRSINNLRIF